MHGSIAFKGWEGKPGADKLDKVELDDFPSSQEVNMNQINKMLDW